MLWLQGTPDVICFDNNKQINKDIINKIDKDRMIKRSIEMPLETIFEAIGWNKKAIFNKNKTLDMFGITKNNFHNII